MGPFSIIKTHNNTQIRYLQSEFKHGYKLAAMSLILKNARSHQRIICNYEKFAKSLNLVLEPTQCKSLSESSGTPKRKVVKIEINDSIIPSLHYSPEYSNYLTTLHSEGHPEE